MSAQQTSRVAEARPILAEHRTRTIGVDPWLPATSFPSMDQAHEAVVLLNAAGIPVGVEVVENRAPEEGEPASPNHASVALVVPRLRVREDRRALLGMRERWW